MIIRTTAVAALFAGALAVSAAPVEPAVPMDPRIVVGNHAGNAYFFDDRQEVPCDCEKCRKFPPPVRDRTHPLKLLGANGHQEQLTIEHPEDLPVTLEISDPTIASLETGDDAGGRIQAMLAGRREGACWLWVKSAGQLLGAVELRCYERRTIRLSYSYVQYLGEPDHAVKNEARENMAWIAALYDKANVGVEWTDNGVLTLEWDLNGDGNSYTADYKEMWSP
jgi:hypothetical protein